MDDVANVAIVLALLALASDDVDDTGPEDPSGARNDGSGVHHDAPGAYHDNRAVDHYVNHDQLDLDELHQYDAPYGRMGQRDQ